MLRGINVSGQNKIKMQDLQSSFLSLGHSDVTTYIQSGNVVFASPTTSAAALARGIEDGIRRDFGLVIAVLLRNKDELAQVIDANPFIEQGADTAKLHVTFLKDVPDPALLHQVDVHYGAPDEFRAVGREIYLHCPQGYGNTKLHNAYWERRLRTPATTRNWNTVNKLLQLAGG